ncbi:response regulator transcription factor [Corynebacterium variabile]|uniref:response regulator transcription factor n=1 Tax=Corynebacterium variabile TaxID=1727 RepID=UPI0028EF4956|nr:response regulator transcription factor [Corynebacterium variabile]
MSSTLPKPLRVRLRNDFEVVVAGLEAMLAPYSDRVSVVSTKVGEDGDEHVDVTLYDTFGLAQVDGEEVDKVLNDPTSGKVVVFTWNMQDSLVHTSIRKGCHGYIDKSVGAQELVECLEAVGRGSVLVGGSGGRPLSSGDAVRPVAGAWPGQDAGLTAREAEVIALITRGFTNEEIARRAYISINTLKSYIRSAYRKIGVERRSQAVRWGIEHGVG